MKNFFIDTITAYLLMAIVPIPTSISINICISCTFVTNKLSSLSLYEEKNINYQSTTNNQGE